MKLQFVLSTFHTRLGWSVNLVLNSGLLNMLFSSCYLHTRLQFKYLTSVGNFAVFSQDDRIHGSMMKCEKLATKIINMIHIIGFTFQITHIDFESQRKLMVWCILQISKTTLEKKQKTRYAIGLDVCLIIDRHHTTFVLFTVWG